MTIDQIYDEIQKANSIVILTHENPDGDAIGSSMAMYHAIKSLNKNVDIIIPEYPRLFDIIPGTSEIKKESDKKYDLAISIDAASEDRLKDWIKYFDEADKRIVIDHHSTNTMFGDINYVDLASPACAEIIYRLLKRYQIEITEEIAIGIMTGIITDTGGFQYSGVSKDTFEIAGDILERGIDLSRIYKKVFGTKTKSSFKLRQIALNRLELLADDKISFTYITKKDEEEVNAINGDYEGIVSEGRSIEGVEVSVFIRQVDGENRYKISLRSNNYVNVSDIAIMFGGGGHIRAAGATTTGTIEEIKEKVINEIKLQLK